MSVARPRRSVRWRTGLGPCGSAQTRAVGYERERADYNAAIDRLNADIRSYMAECVNVKVGATP